jgi:hypothetical protein
MNKEEVFLRTHRAKSWEKRAKNLAKNGHKDLDGEFISWWIALNALYGQPREQEKFKEKHQRIPELQNLTDFINDVSNSPHIREKLTNPSEEDKKNRDEVLENPFLRKDYWNKVSSNSEMVAPNVWQSIEITVESADKDLRNDQISSYLQAIFERLYVLRNQIFHGASKDQSRANRGTLAIAVPVLAEFVPAFIKAVEDQGDKVRSDGIPYPPFKGKKSSQYSPLEQDFQGPLECKNPKQ